MTKRLQPRVARLNRMLAEHDVQQATRELGAAGPRKHLVVRVQEGESEELARERTFAANPWVLRLSEAARARLILIMVVRRPAAEMLSA